MRNAKGTILIAMLFWVVFTPVCLAKPAPRTAKEKRIKALELLDNFAATQEKLQSFIAKSVCLGKAKGGLLSNNVELQKYTTCDARVDGKRASVRVSSWGDINSTMHLTKDKAYYKSHLWDGKDFYAYNKTKIKKEFLKGTVFLVQNAEDKQRPRHTSMFGNFSGAITMGHLPLEVERVDSIIRKANSVFVRDRMEKIGDSDCYVIEAKARSGNYTLWIDPVHSYNIAKAEVRKGPGNVVFASKYKLPENDNIFVFLKNVRFEKIDDLWVPIEADFGHERKHPSGDYYSQATHHKITEIVLNPDHDKLGSFVPDDILNGAEVRIIKGNSSSSVSIPILYTWQNGEVVDEKSHKVDLRKVKGKSEKG